MQNKLQVFQTWIMFGTFLAIISVGVLQYRINDKLYNAQYTPSVELALSQDKMTIHNRGNANLFLIGEQYPGSSSFLPPEGFNIGPRIIPPGGSISLSKHWGEWLKYAKGEVENSQAPSVLFKFAHKFKDHKGNIFIHESFCRFEKEGNVTRLYTDNFGSPAS